MIQEHITGEMSKYKGEIFTWDVVNEAINVSEYSCDNGLSETV